MVDDGIVSGCFGGGRILGVGGRSSGSKERCRCSGSEGGVAGGGEVFFGVGRGCGLIAKGSAAGD